MEDVDFSAVSFEQMNIGIEKYLEKKTGVCKITLDERVPADRHAVLTWEQRNCCLLPEDLKSFYLTSNGFHFTWSVKLDNQTLPVGKMHINGVEQLNRLDVSSDKLTHIQPSLADLDTDSDNDDPISGIEKPTFTGRNRLYELDSCDGYSKVCLVYKEAKAGVSEPTVEIWFLDRALRWHFLASSFLEYYRLMLMHLGLPQWQYAFTDIGLSAQARQWFNMYAPIRLEVDGEITEMHPEKTATDTSVVISTLDVSKVFKSRADRKKQAAGAQNAGQTGQAGKKKPPVSSARSQGSLINRPSQASSLAGSGKGPK
ncbi:LOW QUALITY PROTEIN: tubulin polyglutamylase complex subunit 2-like [Haliotis rubra]|uniref:LOW QUALITY PROTEIN: tubulin polyglutamylase complex subunit 2-like n=1 Tax=Haliotis rubra TaxID=36100 RepID=UPI001EE56DB1|nr:LOW QUALITY PROTEIN: tubulin polyglutamylase complex subunit 2-like [Haliotis rubra]